MNLGFLRTGVVQIATEITTEITTEIATETATETATVIATAIIATEIVHYGELIMATELETNLPSIRQIQTLIQEGKEVELKLITNDLLTGKIRWQDPDCVCLDDHYNQPTIIWRQAIVYMKPKA